MAQVYYCPALQQHLSPCSASRRSLPLLPLAFRRLAPNQPCKASCLSKQGAPRSCLPRSITGKNSNGSFQGVLRATRNINTHGWRFSVSRMQEMDLLRPRVGSHDSFGPVMLKDGTQMLMKILNGVITASPPRHMYQ